MWILGAFDRFGYRGAIGLLLFSGLAEMAPWIFHFFGIVIPESTAHGFGKFGNALALAFAGRVWVKSEAEKRINNPSLGNASIVPQIQNEIQKQTVAIASGVQPAPRITKP